MSNSHALVYLNRAPIIEAEMCNLLLCNCNFLSVYSLCTKPHFHHLGVALKIVLSSSYCHILWPRHQRCPLQALFKRQLEQYSPRRAARIAPEVMFSWYMNASSKPHLANLSFVHTVGPLHSALCHPCPHPNAASEQNINGCTEAVSQTPRAHAVNMVMVNNKLYIYIGVQKPE